MVGRLGVGKAFGELAILYNCKRTANIKVRTHCTTERVTMAFFEKYTIITMLLSKRSS